MIYKHCHAFGTAGKDLFVFSTGRSLIKQASHLDPPVEKFAQSLNPETGYMWLLVHALGAGEFYDSNRNGDIFYEKALCNVPPNWSGDPDIDSALASTWGWGYPTFYNAHAFLQHANKDPDKAVGRVEFVYWNDRMKRVELIIKLDVHRAVELGGEWIFKRLDNGQLVDVSMGCCPPGTLISLSDGTTKAIEGISVGQAVRTHTGKAFTVTDTLSRHYEGSLFSIKVHGFRRPLVLTEEHPVWTLKRTNISCSKPWMKGAPCSTAAIAFSKRCSSCNDYVSYDFDWVKAKDLDVGDYLAYAVPEEINSSISNSNLVEFLGYYLAEGSIHDYNAHEDAQINFSLYQDEVALAARIEELGKKLGASVSWQYDCKDKLLKTVSVVSKELANLCVQHCGKYAKNKILSKDIMLMDKELQKAFLSAYWKGDGGYYNSCSQKGLYFSTSSESLADQLFILLSRCFIISSVNKIYHKPSENSVVKIPTIEYQIWVGIQYINILSEYTGVKAPIPIKLKSDRFFVVKNGVRYLVSPIKDIEETFHNGIVHNLTVSGENTYTANFISVHNSKVPFDIETVTADYDAYNKALATYNPKTHKSPAHAVLIQHKIKTIPGLSLTRADYTDLAKFSINKVFPDGKKVQLDNTFPRFFDISFVFIGAERPAKVMMKLASKCEIIGEKCGGKCRKGECDLFVPNGATMAELDKIASTKGYLKRKLAVVSKKSDISKDTESNFNPKAIGETAEHMEDIPKEVLNELAKEPIEQVLSTSGLSGMVLKPKEFQRIVLVRIGKEDLADKLDEDNGVFSPTDTVESLCPIDHEHYRNRIFSLLKDFLPMRSIMAPFNDLPSRVKRITIISINKGDSPAAVSDSDLLDKISCAYNGYRKALLENFEKEASLAISQNLGLRNELYKFASDGKFIDDHVLRVLSRF